MAGGLSSMQSNSLSKFKSREAGRMSFVQTLFLFQMLSTFSWKYDRLFHDTWDQGRGRRENKKNINFKFQQQ